MRQRRTEATRSARRRLSLRFKVMGALLVLVVIGGGMELFARQLDLKVPILRGPKGKAIMMVGHPTRLWSLAPGTSNNAGVMATIDATGLRGEVPAGPRDPGTHRIMLLGDSTFFGHGVSDASTMAVQLQQRLSARDLPAQVINAAVPGYSTDQALVMMEEMGWSLEPSLLLVGLLWSDNTWEVFRDMDLLKTADRFSDNPLARSRLYQLLSGAIDRLRGGKGARIITWTRKSEWPTTAVRRVDLRRYAQNLDTLVRDAASRGIGVAFLAPANAELVGDEYPRMSYAWSGYFEAQEAVAHHHGQPVVQMLAPFMKEHLSDGQARPIQRLFLDEMHPTGRGHGIMAEAVESVLMEAGWPESSLIGRADEPCEFGARFHDSWDQPKAEVGKAASLTHMLFEEPLSAQP